MLLIFKVGTKYPDDPTRGWRDGQLVDIRPDNGRTKWPNCFCVIRTPHDYWKMRGSTDWKSTQKSVLDFKKLLCVPDNTGKYQWEFGYDEKTAPRRKRDRFVDFKRLLDDKTISAATFDGIYDFSKRNNDIYIDKDLDSCLLHEESYSRLPSDYYLQHGSITSGTHPIGAGETYETVTEFEAAIGATMTGNLTGEHKDEETVIAGVVTFDTNTATYLLKLTAASGAEHNGTFGADTWEAGDGARITYGAFNRINFQETGSMDDVEVSNLVLDIQAASTYGIYFNTGSSSGVYTANRCVLKGSSSSSYGIRQALVNTSITNNIVYDVGDSGDEGGIVTFTHSLTQDILNNTVIGCYNGLYQQDNFYNPGVLTTKNNLVQNSGGADFGDAGAGFGITGRNVSEDATSPDAAYRSKDLHTNSVFKNYGSDDYRLDSGGDATNLAIVDDGENLYGSGVTKDVEGTARDNGTPFWIGASHIVAAAGGNAYTANGSVTPTGALDRKLNMLRTLSGEL